MNRISIIYTLLLLLSLTSCGGDTDTSTSRQKDESGTQSPQQPLIPNQNTSTTTSNQQKPPQLPITPPETNDPNQQQESEPEENPFKVPEKEKNKHFNELNRVVTRLGQNIPTFKADLKATMEGAPVDPNKNSNNGTFFSRLFTKKPKDKEHNIPVRQLDPQKKPSLGKDVQTVIETYEDLVKSLNAYKAKKDQQTDKDFLVLIYQNHLFATMVTTLKKRLDTEVGEIPHDKVPAYYPSSLNGHEFFAIHGILSGFFIDTSNIDEKYPAKLLEQAKRAYEEVHEG